MIGLYLSGTGNTRYCVEYLLRLLDETAEAVPIEEENAAERAAAHSSIVLAYPIQYSNAPLMVRAFIRDHAELWRGKQVLCLATMGAFSGRRRGLRRQNPEEVRRRRHRRPAPAHARLRLRQQASEKAARGKPENRQSGGKKDAGGRRPHPGRGLPKGRAGTLPPHRGPAGTAPLVLRQDGALFRRAQIQRGVRRLRPLRKGLPHAQPFHTKRKALPRGRCTMCYRCISLCPRKAITLLGKEVTEQCRIENYLSNEKEDAE